MKRYSLNSKSVLAVCLLSIFTCGIYGFVWMYSTTKQLNEFNQDYRTTPEMVVLLSLVTCGLYTIYWWYKVGSMFVESQVRARVTPVVDNKFILVLLSVFCLSLISVAIFQADLNQFWQVLDRDEFDGYTSELDDF